jgi:tetratricopeptide (TPR) repeat protein
MWVTRVFSGDRDAAQRLLVDAHAADLRCLDAYAHLGNFAFDRPEDAIRYYETGVRIGQLSLPEGFDGLLPWGRIDNRPFLRCLHGYGLCLRQLGRSNQAAAVFERMLWLNPVDNQGVRGLLPAVHTGKPWQADA